MRPILDMIGPKWIVDFEEIDDDEEKERLQRDVFERVNAFLEMLEIKLFMMNSNSITLIMHYCF